MYLSRLERAPHEVKAELTSIQFQWGMRNSCQKARARDGIRDGAASPPRGELEQRARVLKEQERRAESTQQWVDLARRRYERTEAETRELELNQESLERPSLWSSGEAGCGGYCSLALRQRAGRAFPSLSLHPALIRPPRDTSPMGT